MSVKSKVLKQSDFLPIASGTVVFGPVTVPTLIDKCNSAAVLAGVVTMQIIPAGGTAGALYRQAKRSFNVDDTYTWPEMVGQMLNVGDSVAADSTVASAVTLRISGREIT